MLWLYKERENNASKQTYKRRVKSLLFGDACLANRMKIAWSVVLKSSTSLLPPKPKEKIQIILPGVITIRLNASLLEYFIVFFLQQSIVISALMCPFLGFVFFLSLQIEQTVTNFQCAMTVFSDALYLLSVLSSRTSVYHFYWTLDNL